MVDTLLDASRHLQRAVTAKLRLDRRVVKRDGKTFKFNVPIITPVGDVAAILEAATPMAVLPVARDVQVRPDLTALPPAAPVTRDWPSDEPSNLEGYVEPVDNSVDNEYVAPVDNLPDDVIVKGKHTQLMITLEAVGYTPDERHELVRYVSDGEYESTKELTYRHMPAMWTRIQTRATIEVQSLFGLIWRESALGWEALRKYDGLEGEVGTWTMNEWLIALTHCRDLHAKMQD